MSCWCWCGSYKSIIVLEVLTAAKRTQHQMAKRMIGRYIVADPEICHGQPTFRGTRILVADVMEQVAGGIAWETIVEGWRGDVSPDAISEARRTFAVRTRSVYAAARAFRTAAGWFLMTSI